MNIEPTKVGPEHRVLLYSCWRFILCLVEGQSSSISKCMWYEAYLLYYVKEHNKNSVHM